MDMSAPADAPSQVTADVQISATSAAPRERSPSNSRTGCNQGKCLLCGHYRTAGSLQRLPFSFCSWCEEEAHTLKAEELSAIAKLEQIQPYFTIWSSKTGRREDISECQGVSKTLAMPQPARPIAGLRLFLGDMDDAFDVEHLKKLRVKLVVTLCPERIKGDYWNLPVKLARSEIRQLILPACDRHDFNITPDAELAIEPVKYMLDKGHGVLVHCWGGVNRSTAVLVACLVASYKVPLFAAVQAAMKTRGTVLTNQAFRKQLVRHFYAKSSSAGAGVSVQEILEGDVIPAALLQEIEDDEDVHADGSAVDQNCSDGGGRKHRPERAPDYTRVSG